VKEADQQEGKVSERRDQTAHNRRKNSPKIRKREPMTASVSKGIQRVKCRSQRSKNTEKKESRRRGKICG